MKGFDKREMNDYNDNYIFKSIFSMLIYQCFNLIKLKNKRLKREKIILQNQIFEKTQMAINFETTYKKEIFN